jgi:hypothetical protein
MGATRNFYRARNPQRVLDKARECRYFLDEVAEHENAGSIDKFMYSLSAFLKSFRSIAYRLYGVTENQSSHDEMKALESQLNAHWRVGFLIDQANLEVHGDGAVIWRRFNVSVSDDIQERWPSRWSSRFRGGDRWPSRLISRFRPPVRTQAIVEADWQFAGKSSSLLDLCGNGLEDIESLVRQKIALSP